MTNRPAPAPPPPASDGLPERLALPRLDPRQLADEEQVIWLVDAEELAQVDYVRELFGHTATRRGRPQWNHWTGRLIGYAELKPPARVPKGQRRGQPRRRLFWLAPHDRGQGCDVGHYATTAPHEAIDPRTVAVGRPGWSTARSWWGRELSTLPKQSNDAAAGVPPGSVFSTAPNRPPATGEEGAASA